jgi:hypothetical protein
MFELRDYEDPPPDLLSGRDQMMRGFREPFLQFVLLAIAVVCLHFLVSRATSTPRAPAAPTPVTPLTTIPTTNLPTVILISREHIQAMAEGFARHRQRLPTQEELEGLIQERVREEVYYREALALGLDRDDAVIRKRLRQRLEQAAGGKAAAAEPEAEELQAYLDAHREKFRVEARYTFRQVYLDPERRRGRLADDTARLLAQLREAGTNAGIADVGDVFRHGPDFNAVPASEVTKELGEKFTAKLAELPLGRWQGPIESTFGPHLVFLSQRTASREPALAEVREVIQREWMDAQPQPAHDNFYQQLLKHYQVIIERPGPQ